MKKILQRMPRMLIAGIILLALLTISTLAILSAYNRSSPKHTFQPAPEADPTINDTSFYVNVGNPGYAVYVRAAIVVNWENASGNLHATAPKLGTDYTLNLNTTDWFEGSDGFYYHRAMVNSGGKTEKLIDTCAVVAGKAPADYHLDVQIIAQTIQALGTTDAVDANGNPVDGTPAVTDAWGIGVDPTTKQLVSPTT